MVRLVGVDLPRNKRIAYALTYIHGIGLTSAKKIIEVANINPETRTNDITLGRVASNAKISAPKTVNLFITFFL